MDMDTCDNLAEQHREREEAGDWSMRMHTVLIGSKISISFPSFRPSHVLEVTRAFLGTHLKQPRLILMDASP